MYTEVTDNKFLIKKNIDGSDANIIEAKEVVDKKYDVGRKLEFQIERAKKLGVEKFYISFHWQYDPVMSGMMGAFKEDKYIAADCGSFTSIGNTACPTPHFNQMVYKYDHGHIETLWFIPNHREFWQILKGEKTARPEVMFWVRSAYNGDLFKLVDRENREETIGKQLLVADIN